jgi:hypothetical protein
MVAGAMRYGSNEQHTMVEAHRFGIGKSLPLSMVVHSTRLVRAGGFAAGDSLTVRDSSRSVKGRGISEKAEEWMEGSV